MIFKDIAEDVETKSDTSNFELDRYLKKKCKSNWTNERWFMWENDDNMSWINRKNMA